MGKMSSTPETTSTPEKIIFFSRYPEPGTAKTRLIPALGPQGAAELQRKMTEHAIRYARRVAANRGVSIEVFYDGDSESNFRQWLGEGLEYRAQIGGNLGERMADAFERSFDAGAQRIVLIGTDCPDLTDDLMVSALQSLELNDVVLGPAMDGGYYLIGLTRPVPALFEGILWGAGDVAGITLRIASDLGLSLTHLTELIDVDRPEDLAVWDRIVGDRFTTSSTWRISVIIPTLDEARNIVAAVTSAQQGGADEILVVDGGSRDGTIEAAESHGVRVLTSERGRAAQLNIGGREASGDILLFLHADTLLPKDFAGQVKLAMSDPAAAGGAFKLQIDSPEIGLRVIESLANWRSRRFRMPYGDQAIFVRADIFREMGGFPDLPIMDDFEFVRKLKLRGLIKIVPSPVITSARRWSNLGVLRTTVINQTIIIAYYLGVSPARMIEWYSRRRHAP